ncbi:MAG TPA: PKD domain-containing protein [Tepidisphaeraceae bacterium]|nr:PKD domain-containing protein [Tepidisphaeraceae bacterium]
MRQKRYLSAAAALTAGLAIDGTALADTVDVGVQNLTVSAVWRAQPSTIQQGGTTAFKLSLRATGDDATTGIKFGASTFHFESGTGDSAPTSADLALAPTAPSAGKTASAMLAPLSVTYFEDGVYTATISAHDAGIQWNQGGVASSGTYSLNIGTTINVGSALPTIESASVPVLIGAGDTFGFSALADAGALGGLSYQWDFDYDGSFAADSTQQNPNFAYSEGGTYTGMLRVLSDTGYTPFAFTVNVMQDNVVPMPLPGAVWGGLGLVAAVGLLRARMALRAQRLQQF